MTIADPTSNTIAGVASLVVPGAGQATNGDYDTAAAHFGIFAVSVYGALRYQKKSDYVEHTSFILTSGNRGY